MTKEEAKKEIENIKQQIKQHEKLYFDNAETDDSDYQYDCLFKRLNELELLFPELKEEDSPTQYVKTNITSGFKKYQHTIPMLSLKKTYSFDELGDFLTQAENTFGEISYCCEPKLDGVSVNMRYKNGILESISTRGDGHIGDNITRNFEIINDVPQIINTDEEIDIRGEALMTFDRFNEGKDIWSNPRNATAGLLRTLKQTINKKMISVFVYDFLPHNFTTQDEMLNKLKELKLRVPEYKICKTQKDVFDYINFFEKRRKELSFPTDGVVIKFNELGIYDKLGATNKSPRWAIAFKYKPDSVSTKLKFINYQVGRTGVITPVATFEPISLSGSIIKCATLHNPMELKRLNIHHNDYVLVQKGGEIIPKIIGIDITKRNFDAKQIEFITLCPSCNSKLTYKNDLCYCKNPDCPDKITNIIAHFVSKKAMNIESLGEKTIKLLIKNNLIHNFTDLYDLEYEMLINLEGFDIVSTNKLLEGIKKSCKRSFKHVLFSIGIIGVGEVISENIVRACKDINTLMQMSMEDLMKIPLVGYEIAVNIKNFFSQQSNLEIITKLKDAGLQFCIQENDTEQNLQGQTFAITGTFEIDREEIKEMILRRGGIFSSSVSKKTDYLLVGSEPSITKLEKAKELKIQTIENLEFVKLTK